MWKRGGGHSLLVVWLGLELGVQFQWRGSVEILLNYDITITVVCYREQIIIILLIKLNYIIYITKTW